MGRFRGPGRAPGIWVAFGIVVLLAGCGGQSVGSAAGLEPEGRLERLTAADARVAAVHHRLTTVNLDLCADRGHSPGWILHAASQYGPQLRPLAESRHGLDRDLPGVLAATPGGPAARAGLTAGDLILTVGGRVLDPGATGGAARHDGLARNLQVIRAALGDGPVRLTVRRADQARTVILTPEPACDHAVQVEPGEDRNARANGRMVFITVGMVHFAESDAELAFVLGHELAHNILGHRDADGRLTTHGRGARAESEADWAGLCLAMRAGYDLSDLSDFWRRFAAADWRARFAQPNHPSARSRALALDAWRERLGGDPAQVARACGAEIAALAARNRDVGP